MFTEYRLINIDLQLFADMNTQVTSSEGLTDGMKTYYSDYLIDLVEAELVHDQFAQKHPIPSLSMAVRPSSSDSGTPCLK